MEVSYNLHALPPGARAPGTRWVAEGWVRPRAGLDAVAKRKKSLPCHRRESNPSRSAIVNRDRSVFFPSHYLGY
jgi:hypothetical protein